MTVYKSHKIQHNVLQIAFRKREEAPSVDVWFSEFLFLEVVNRNEEGLRPNCFASYGNWVLIIIQWAWLEVMEMLEPMMVFL